MPRYPQTHGTEARSRQTRMILLLLATFLLAALPGRAATLGDAVSSAMARAGAADPSGGDDALPALRNGWLAASPYLEGSYIDSQPALGTDEAEIALNLPIKASAQRQADAQLVDLDARLENTGRRYRRWYLSGQVRELAWAERLAELEERTAQQRLATIEKLAERARSLSRSGAITRYQRLLIEQQQLDAKVRLGAASASLAKARDAFENLTGFAQPPETLMESLAASSPDFAKHPLLERLSLQQAQQEKVLEASTPARSNWNLALIARNFESPGLTEEQYGVAVQLPLNFLGTRSVSNDANIRQQRRSLQQQRDQQLLDLRSQWLDAWRERERLLEESKTLEESLAIAEALQQQLSLLEARNEIEAEVMLSRTLDVLDRRARLVLVDELIGRNTARLNQLAGQSL